MILIIVVIQRTKSQIREDKESKADDYIGWKGKSDPSCENLLPKGSFGEPWDMKSTFICEYTVSNILLLKLFLVAHRILVRVLEFLY